MIILFPVFSFYLFLLFMLRTLRQLVNVFYSKCPSYVNLLVRSYKLNKWYLFHVHMFTCTHIYYNKNLLLLVITLTYPSHILITFFIYVEITSKYLITNVTNIFYIYKTIYYIIDLAKEIKVFC